MQSEREETRFLQKRRLLVTRLSNAFDQISEKYGEQFQDEADEIDIHTGEVVVDNGHINSMRHDRDVRNRALEEKRRQKKLSKAEPQAADTTQEPQQPQQADQTPDKVDFEAAQTVQVAPLKSSQLGNATTTPPISPPTIGSGQGDPTQVTPVGEANLASDVAPPVHDQAEAAERLPSPAQSNKENERPILYDRLRDASPNARSPSPQSEVNAMMADQLNVDRTVFQNFMTAVTDQIQAAVAVQLREFTTQLSAQLTSPPGGRLRPAFGVPERLFRGGSSTHSALAYPLDSAAAKTGDSDKDDDDDASVATEYPDIDEMPSLLRSPSPGGPSIWHPRNTLYRNYLLHPVGMPNYPKRPSHRSQRLAAAQHRRGLLDDEKQHNEPGSDMDYEANEDGPGDEEEAEADTDEEKARKDRTNPDYFCADGRRRWKRTKFNPQEEVKLLKLWWKTGLTWNEIAGHFPGRSGRQVQYKVAKMIGEAARDNHRLMKWPDLLAKIAKNSNAKIPASAFENDPDDELIQAAINPSRSFASGSKPGKSGKTRASAASRSSTTPQADGEPSTTKKGKARASRTPASDRSRQSSLRATRTARASSTAKVQIIKKGNKRMIIPDSDAEDIKSEADDIDMSHIQAEPNPGEADVEGTPRRSGSSLKRKRGATEYATPQQPMNMASSKTLSRMLYEAAAARNSPSTHTPGFYAERKGGTDSDSEEVEEDEELSEGDEYYDEEMDGGDDMEEEDDEDDAAALRKFRARVARIARDSAQYYDEEDGDDSEAYQEDSG